MTIFLILFFILLLILLVGFLFVPIVLYIDTDEKRYEVYQFPVMKVWTVWQDYSIKMRMKLAGISIPIPNKDSAKPVRANKRNQGKKPFKKSGSAWRFLIFRLINSFEIKSIIVDIDTDDVVTNAQLVPLFQLANRGPIHLASNFQGRVYLHLEVYNSPARLLWIFLQFLTKK